MSEPRPCECCGQRVAVQTADEGTQSYVPMEAALVREDLARQVAADRDDALAKFKFAPSGTLEEGMRAGILAAYETILATLLQAPDPLEGRTDE